ncbi:unnamed protein product, partial [Iphiclides podalirius]
MQIRGRYCTSALTLRVVAVDCRYPNLNAWFNRCKEQDFYKKGNVPGLTILGDMLRSKLE